MKVLHILHELKFSGAEIMYAGAAPVFQGCGCQLYVVNTTQNLGEYAGHFKQAGFKVLKWPYPNNIFKRWAYYHRVVRYIRREKIDVIHIHDSRLKFGMSYCAWRGGIKSIYSFHSCFHNPTLTRPYQMLLRWTAKNIFHCTFQSISDSVYENELNEYHNKTQLVYNWYNTRKFYPAKDNEKERIRKELGISDADLVLITVGGCSEIKRHTDIIKALPDILKDYPRAVYLHLGCGATLEEERTLAKVLNVATHVLFCGNQDNVRKYLVASDVYLMPSKFEGISITTIEAMACKIPSILYDVPGLRDFNKNKKCAALIPENYNLIAHSIKELMTHKQLREELASNGYTLIKEQYDMEKNAKEIYSLYCQK